MLINADLVRRRRDELRLTLRMLATACDTSPGVIVALEAGRNHADIKLGFLRLLADALAVDVATLLVDTHSKIEAPTEDDDAARVGTLLHATGVLTPVSVIADITGWPPQRIDDALDILDVRLGAAGMRLHRLQNRYAIAGAVEPVEDGDILRAVRAHLARDGMNLTEARLLRTIIAGRLPNDLRNADAVALAVLVNAALVHHPAPAVPTSQRPAAVTDDVAFSLCAC